MARHVVHRPMTVLRIGPGLPGALRISPEPAPYRAGPQVGRRRVHLCCGRSPEAGSGFLQGAGMSVCRDGTEVAASGMDSATGRISFNAHGEVRKDVQVQAARDGAWRRYAVISAPVQLGPRRIGGGSQVRATVGPLSGAGGVRRCPVQERRELSDAACARNAVVGSVRNRRLIQRQRGQVGKKRREALDRQPVGGAFRVGLGLGALRDLGLLHRRVPPRPGAFPVVVLFPPSRTLPPMSGGKKLPGKERGKRRVTFGRRWWVKIGRLLTRIVASAG